MASVPCSICHQRFVGAAITGYHRWYLDGTSYGYKQKVCFPCAQTWLAPIQAHAMDANSEEATWPTTCGICGEACDGDAEMTYSTWYRGKTRRDTVLVLCPHCMPQAREVMMRGADRLENRERSGGEGGGAPSLTPAGRSSVEDLPW